jgi:hypothetical protein
MVSKSQCSSDSDQWLSFPGKLDTLGPTQSVAGRWIKSTTSWCIVLEDCPSPSERSNSLPANAPITSTAIPKATIRKQ